MAINPDAVNIINIPELQAATSVQDSDMLIIGQGVMARRSTVLALYQKFGIASIIENVTNLQGQVEDLPTDSVLFSPQLLTPTQQQTARDNIAALGTADLNGFVYDVTYNSTNHQITFYQQNEPNIVIDLPIEQLIKGVELVGNDLVFTFEDGSTVTVPLNTLLVGVVKSVNGLTPNSQGALILNITDIPGLSSSLDAKANQNGNYPNMTVGNATKLNNLSDTDFVKKDGTVPMTGTLVLNSSSANKATLKGSTPSGNNFFSYQNNSGTETHSLGMSASSNDNFYFYTDQPNDWLFFSNGNQIFKINDQSVQSYRNLIIPDAIANNHAVTLGQVNWLNANFINKNGSVAMENYLPFNGNDSVNKGIVWRTSGSFRFVLMTDPDQESGGNTGSNLTLYRYADNGSFIGNVFRINRATGIVTFQDNIATVSQYTSAEWAQAYNERVTQFNTTYTTSVYTFSLLLGNGTTKSTNLQVSNTHFTINGSGVLQLNAAIAQRINDSVTTNTQQTISATKDFTVSPNVPYASAPTHAVPYDQMTEYISNRFDAISSYSRNVINTNGSTIGVKEWIKTIVFTTNATGTILNPEETLKNGACLNICTQAITAGSIYVNMPVRRLDGSTDSVFSCAQGYSYVFYYNESDGRWEETHGIYNN